MQDHIMSRISILSFWSSRNVFLVFAIVIVIAMAIVDRAEIWTLAAPELFTRSEAYMLRFDPLIGIIKTPWNVLLLYGTPDDCKIAYIVGEIPGQYAGPVPCSFMFNQYGNKFIGWIDFRGHRRPFCGTTTGEFMHACKDW